ncbi:MAG: protease Lon-related BREX system protein BrxL [Chloroflexi bacterium]|nr:protease Lon-related BREX system protein BrxL [Chloroflexota bacterium]MDA8187562.1 protease Lon-related BREX system protein BrxL [Dehalococcoidales bacterium]
MSSQVVQDELDRKVLEQFPGRVVRKDLVGKVKGQLNVPAYVLEYLLGKYCSSGEEDVVDAGLGEVKRVLIEHYVHPDQSEWFKSQVKAQSQHRVIDKVKVRLVETEDKHWASLVNLQIDRVHISEELVQRYERLLAGGVWAIIDLAYDPQLIHKGDIRPFNVIDLRPIQLAASNLLDEVRQKRPLFSHDEWVDFLLRSIGLEPAQLTSRLRMLYLARLIPLVENNFNLVEFGPRMTGKSYVYREITPYAILVSGGDVTVPSLFVSHTGKGRLGLVGLWDVVAFDEVAGLTRLANAQAINLLKDYMESGSFSRGREEITAPASLVFIGNINIDVDVALRTSHLFTPFPPEMQDLAFLDRFHMYLPGWELPKMASALLTTRYGLVVDYLSEVFRELRKLTFGDALDRYFDLGEALNKRDEKAVRKTVSGYVKLLHPDGNYTKSELEEYLSLALELRRRVKEQLRRMGGVEYWNTSLSYRDRDTGAENFVAVPEQGEALVIPPDPLPPGTTFTVGLDAESQRYALFRVEVALMKGGGFTATGAVGKSMKEAIRTAYDYLRSNVHRFTIDRSLEDLDVHFQVVNLMQAKEGSQTAAAFFIALFSALVSKPIRPGTVVLGEITIQGGVLPVTELAECVQLARENGARRVLVPTTNARDIPHIPYELLTGLELAFYADPKDCLLKALQD